MCIAGYDLLALCAEWLPLAAQFAVTWLVYTALKAGMR